MATKVEAAETTPYASNPSDANFAPPAAAAAGGDDSVGEEGGFMSGEEEFEAAFDRPLSEAGDFGKSSVIGVDNYGSSDVGSLESPLSGNVPVEEKPPSSKVDDDREISEKGDIGRDDSISTEVTSWLSPKPKGASNEMVGDKGVDVSEEKDSFTFEDASEGDGEGKLENASVGVGEKDAIAEGVLDEKSVSDGMGDEKVWETETEVKGVEETDGSKHGEIDVEVKKEDGLIIDSEIKEKEIVSVENVDDDNASDKFCEGDGVKLTDEGDSIVDSSAMQSVYVDVAKPGVAVVGDVEESKEVKLKETPIMADDGDLKVDYNFDQISHDEEGGNEVQSVKSTDEAGVTLSSEGDAIVDSSTLNSVHISPAEPGIVIVGSANGETDAKLEEMEGPGNEIDPDSPNLEDDDLTTAYDGNYELAVKDTVETAEVESDGPKLDADGAADSKDVRDGEGENLHSDKSTEEAGVTLTSKIDAIVDSSIVNSVHVSPAEPGIVVVGRVNGEKDPKQEEEGNDEIDPNSPNLGESDDLTAANDGNFELASKETVEAAGVEFDGPKHDINGSAESENVRDGERDEDLVTESSQEESSMAAEANAEVEEAVSEEKVVEEGLQVEDIVSTREFRFESKPHRTEYGSESDGETDEMVFGSSEAAKQFLEELEKASSGVEAHSDEANISNNQSERIDGQIVTDSEDEADTDDDGEEKLFDSAALAALLKAATGGSSEGGDFTITSQDGTRLFSVERPAGLGSSLRSVRPVAPRPNRSNLFTQPNVPTGGESEINLSEEERKKLENLQSLRVKFLRLVQRLGHSAEDSIAAQVLYRIALHAGRQSGQLFSLDTAKKMAAEREAEGKDDLEFSLNILVLGKAGVGKSATINSILGDQKASIDAFGPATTSVREISGTVNGVKIRIIDTPGLKSSAMDQSTNSKLLSSVKKVTKKCPPDIVLYVDRLDAQSRDLNNLPLLRTITATLGSSIWKNAIVALTHAASAPPDGPSGTPLGYDVFVAQCSHIVQQSIGQAVGDLRLMNPSLMNPVSLVENHPLCRKNRDGEKVLPNGQTWRPQLLLLCYSLKILAEANSLLKPQEPLDHRKLFGFRVRSPPLPYLLSWLLQSRTHPKLSAEQGGDSVDSDIELDDVSDSEPEDGEDDEYDQLPPFKPLRRSQLAKLSKEQRKAYFEEYDYRVKLLQKKQWREELKRMREMKKKGKNASENEYSYLGEEEDPENAAPAAVPVPLPDMVLPPSFDSDNPAYRYRFLEPTSQLLTRPVLDTHGWDHDCGYDGVNVEHSLAVANRFPAALTVQVTKDKKEFNIHLDSSVSAKHGENGSTLAGFDIQNVGKQLAYVVRGETKFKNLKKNKTTLGGSVTFLGENVATGVKLEDQIAIGKRLLLVGSTGMMRSQGDSAYGANLEIKLREADFPIGQDQSSLGLSLVKWRGDLALGANLQSQVSVGRHSKVAVRAGLNNKMSGQITVRTSSSDQLQIALAAILPIAMSIYKSIRPGDTSDKYSMY